MFPLNFSVIYAPYKDILKSQEKCVFTEIMNRLLKITDLAGSRFTAQMEVSFYSSALPRNALFMLTSRAVTSTSLSSMSGCTLLSAQSNGWHVKFSRKKTAASHCITI